MYCIVGLGNPEKRYSLTRHNIGFRIADQYAQMLGVSFRSGRGEYLLAKGAADNEPVIIVKPATFMNRSGTAVQHVMQYYKIPTEEALIVLDDLDLPFGTFRFRPGGSDGGNRGLRSIITLTGTESIPRLRIGIRNREKIANPRAYVLSQFARRERAVIPRLLEKAGEAVQCWITGGIDRAMNTYNRHHDFGAE